jgi:hypothetical protein
LWTFSGFSHAPTGLDAKMSRGFAWLAGLQVAVLASVMSVLFGP